MRAIPQNTLPSSELLLTILETSNAQLPFKGPSWYLSFRARFKKNVLNEKKKIKL
jgi:hypothetical protein